MDDRILRKILVAQFPSIIAVYFCATYKLASVIFFTV